MPMWTVRYDEVVSTPVTAVVEADDEETARTRAETGETVEEERDTARGQVLRRVVQSVTTLKES
jgi:hypothetical protein